LISPIDVKPFAEGETQTPLVNQVELQLSEESSW
jgi:hypothetical protein